MTDISYDSDEDVERIAVIGYSGKFPGAGSVEKFWENIRSGVESITRFTDEELLENGVPEQFLEDPSYVKAGTVLEDADCFDAEFFGYSPREASLTDPQQRLFLEGCWAALEHAGYNPQSCPGAVSVFAGSGMSSYASYFETDAEDTITDYQLMIGNDKDFLSTRVAYLLNLTGPSLSVQTACSTSLVAIHLAAQSLLSYQSDMALAGGVSLFLPHRQGYFHREGMIMSPDGHCRAFDANGQGIVVGRGFGVVVLKRLSEAIEDGDSIKAVLKATAINNDGSGKIGYTAPSVEGQAEVITTALALAEVEPDSIGYVEAHGTGTPLGDPIEVAALTAAYRNFTDKSQYCAIGSVKTNVGHMDTAAGVTGFIKSVLSVEKGEIPPSLNYKQPNPEIDFEATPFYVNEKLQSWQGNGSPRRAAVSSFGIGGTNAHAIVEQAPEFESVSDDSTVLIVSSGLSESASLRNMNAISETLEQPNELNLADVAFTLQLGRKHFPHRSFTVASRSLNQGKWHTGKINSDIKGVSFLFSGQGAQYVGMGQKLYLSQSVFRDALDQCFKIYNTATGNDLKTMMFAADNPSATTQTTLNQTAIAQPALFSIEYALAKLWESLGIVPTAVVGHSLGEYTAACIAGVFSLQDALSLVIKRGELMQSMPAGSMLAVSASPEVIEPYLDAAVSVAALNSPGVTVVSGPNDEVESLATELKSNDIMSSVVHTSHAFHSSMMEPMLDAFKAEVQKVERNTPSIPLLSNLTGTFITDTQATDPQYWADHIRHPVLFESCITKLADNTNTAFLEVGPGQILSRYCRQILGSNDTVIASSLPTVKQQAQAESFFLEQVGCLWLGGIEPDWSVFHKGSSRRRVSLPTYSFEKNRFWHREKTDPIQTKKASSQKNANINEWHWIPSWQRMPIQASQKSTVNEFREKEKILLFSGQNQWSAAVEAELAEQCAELVIVKSGSSFQSESDDGFTIDPTQFDHFEKVFVLLKERNQLPDRIVNSWNADDDLSVDASAVERRFNFGMLAWIHVLKALDTLKIDSVDRLVSLTCNAYDVTNDEIALGKSSMAALSTSAAQEFPNISVKTIDVSSGDSVLSSSQLAIDLLDRGLSGEIIAYRGAHRWSRAYLPMQLPATEEVGLLGQSGTFLITGGLGGVGFAIAEHIARNSDARLVIMSRTGVGENVGEHGVAEKRIAQLRSLCVDVLVIQGDVTLEKDWVRAVAETEKKFGPINGVVHAAGSVPRADEGHIRDIDARSINAQLAPKVEGSLHLKKVFNNYPLRFCVFTSSLSSVLGGLGLGVYAAANSFLDDFVASQNQVADSHWIGLNLDAWDTSGDKAVKSGMSREEGMVVFGRALDNGFSGQLITSTQSLASRLEQWVHIDKDVIAANDDLAESNLLTQNENLDSPAEKLRSIWEELLGVSDIGLNDNFVELGGDSLLGMNVISRANRMGLQLTSQLLSDHPTIGELAELCSTATIPESATSFEEIGELPLLPNVCRYLSRGSSINQWNVSVLLSTVQEVDTSVLSSALEMLEERHAALRIRFDHKEVDGWVQRIVPTGTDPAPLSSYDYSQYSAKERKDFLNDIAHQLNTDFDISNGPLYRVAKINLGEEGFRIFIVAHHFVVEGVSVGILLSDLGACIEQINSGVAAELPKKSVPFLTWAKHLQKIANQPENHSALDFWRGHNWSSFKSLPVDGELTSDSLKNSQARQIQLWFSEEETRALLRPRTISVEVLLIQALAQAYRYWSSQTSLLVDRLGHGRTVSGSDFVDVSHTVGFFLSYTPIVLDSIDEADADGRSLAPVIEEFLQRDGEFDRLRWMSLDQAVRDEFASFPVPEISFNYRGRIDQTLPVDSLFSRAPEIVSQHEHNPDGQRFYPLSIVVDVIDDALSIRLVYSEVLHQRADLEKLVEAFGDQIKGLII